MKDRLLQPLLPGLLVLGLVVALAASGFAQMKDAPKREWAETTLEQLSDILQRLEGELSALEAPRAEQLEDALEQLVELIEDLLDAFETPTGSSDRPSIQARLLRLDERLHKLISVLNRLFSDDAAIVRPGAREALDDLRNWVDGYIDGATAGMTPEAAEKLEHGVHAMVCDLAQRIGETLRGAQPDAPDFPKLERLLDRLQRLDTLIHSHFPGIPAPSRK